MMAAASDSDQTVERRLADAERALRHVRSGIVERVAKIHPGDTLSFGEGERHGLLCALAMLDGYTQGRYED